LEIAPLKEVSGPFGTINALAFSEDGRYLLSGPGVFMPGVQVFPIRKWDSESMTEVAKLEGHKRGIICLDVLHSSGLLASASFDDTLRVWDVAENREIGFIHISPANESASIACLKFSPTGDALISGGGEVDGKNLSIWDWKEKKLLKRILCEGRPNCLALANKGNRIVVGGEQGARPNIRPFLALVDLDTGEAIRNFASSGRDITSVAVSPDGQMLIAGDSRGLLEFYRLQDGGLLRIKKGHKKRVEDICFLSTHGDAITAGRDGRIVRWNTLSGTEQWSLETARSIWSMAVSPARDLVAVGGENGRIAIWKLSDMDEKLTQLPASE